ncbi:MAG: glycosyltransferase [Dehalococcoidia bacterium]|nr:glycosyltransferase [Dehalococcoidia bacterium]
MRVCYFGTFDESFPRNSVLIQGLLENGVKVILCQSSLWSGTEDKIRGVKGMGRNPLSPALVRRVFGSYYRLWREHRKIGRYDVMVVGYAGHFDMLLAAPLAWIRRKPLVFDAFLSLHATAVEDRKVVGPGSLMARGLWWIDKLSCSLADLVLMDTQAHIDWYAERYRLPGRQFRRVLMGAGELEPVSQSVRERCGAFKVLYFGQFIPLHGVEHILGAARELRHDPEISFELVGEGQTYDEAERLARDQGLTNVTFVPGWFPPDELASRVRKADVCLGVFGLGRKSELVIPQKVVFAIALGRPVLTRDSPAVREVFTPGRDIMVCQPGSPQSLASSILALKADPSLGQRIGQEGYRLFRERFSPRAVGETMKDVLMTVCEAR